MTGRAPGRTPTPRIRTASADDLPFLERMLYEAANWRRPSATAEVATSLPEIARYVRGWATHPGDVGVIAESERGVPVGAAWYRFFSRDEPGYGFVDESIPEVTIAVAAGSRRRGVGRALLDELIDRASHAGVGALSLSVEEDNPALFLYLSCGFRKVRDAGGAVTMLRDVG